MTGRQIAHYGKRWQTYRKLIQQHFMESIVERDHLPVQNAEACQFLYDMMTMPENHMLHPKRYSNSIACSTLWGVRTPTVDTPHMKRLYDMMEDWSVVMVSLSWSKIGPYSSYRSLATHHQSKCCRCCTTSPKCSWETGRRARNMSVMR